MSFRRLVLLIALFVPFGSASAQHPLVLNKLNAWNEAAPMPGESAIKAEVHRKAEEIYRASIACANSNIIIDKIEPATADRNAFNALVQGTMKNAWFVTTRMPECDPAPVRYMVMQYIDNSLKAIRVNRGEAYAWESLIGDTFPLVQLAAISALKRKGSSCSVEGNAALGVTRIASKESGLGPDIFGIRYSGSWTEVWPIEVCRQTVEVLIRFTADGDGGAFTNIPGDQIRVLP